MFRRRAGDRVDRLLSAGDRLLAKGKSRAALKKYRAAEALDATQPRIYAKLIDAHAAGASEWTAADLATSLAWEMRRQELAHPALREVHARLQPEWDAVMRRVRDVLRAEDAATVRRLTEEIVGYGADAVRPLVEFLLRAFGKTPPVSPIAEDAE
ncbi:MAG: hypothetical protein HY543_07955 [Deltaproteobacteria bacterium]|nr:hypothetical protein [Deltaproteobacteria bacterium]